MAIKFTPMNLIGSIMSLAAFAGLVTGFNAYFMPRAEADEIIGKVTRQQQVDRVETDLSVIEVEKSYLRDKIKEDPTDEDAKKRLEYLEKKQLILEEYQLQLQSED
jgi:CRISPR/Cas system CMR subunit Cmr4 (Cas7 group RAMP superfamily)